MPQATSNNAPPTPSNTWKLIIPAFVIFAFYYVSVSGKSPEDEITTKGSSKQTPVLKVATWNIAAINNNPFEYWVSITTDQQLKTSYNQLMEGVAAAIQKPTAKDDKTVSEVFSQDKFEELIQAMEDAGVPKTDLTKVETRWTDDFKDRKIISEFIKDSSIGKKRLASMPDRYTNTIKTDSGMIYRPTVINCYDKTKLSTQDQWWGEWKKFMFSTPIAVTSSKGSKSYPKIFKLLKKISRAKYPEVTEEEEAISIPLQTVAAAIFDGVLVHLLNSQKVGWEDLRSQMCKKLNKNKNNRITEILTTKYRTEDTVFLQEVSSDFLSVIRKDGRSPFDIHTSEFADNDRNQNSVILLKKAHECSVKEVTSAVTESIEKAPFAKGDLFVIKANCNNGDFLYASFHGDTDGLATIPIVKAVKAYSDSSEGKGFRLLFGMDANSHAKPKDPAKQLDVTAFAKFYLSVGLTSCYGDDPDPTNYTTFHARTYLQPQLNKAITFAERDTKGDKNPKDHILFSKSDFSLTQTVKDNTGKKNYVDGLVFPTFDFPSDHGITSAKFDIL